MNDFIDGYFGALNPILPDSGERNHMHWRILRAILWAIPLDPILCRWYTHQFDGSPGTLQSQLARVNDEIELLEAAGENN